MAPSQRHWSGRNVPYTDAELFEYGPQKTYRGQELREIAFPLGGIGTGCISLSGSGELVDWEIFNRPNKGFRPDNTYFMLFAQAEGGPPVFRVMEGRLQPPFQGYQHGAQPYRGFGFGPPREFGSGFLRFSDCAFTGEFPFACVELSDRGQEAPAGDPPCPLEVRLEAWSPFVPLDDRSSSYPVAIFDVTLHNPTARPVQATVALGLQNIVGWPQVGDALTELRAEEGFCALNMTSRKHASDSPRAGSMALLAPGVSESEITYQLRFAETAWFAQTESLMDEFGTTGEFRGPRDPQVSGDHPPTAHLGLKVSLQPGESCTRTLILAWLTPNFEMYWAGGDPKPTWKTWHATQWADALEVGREVALNLDSLRSRTRRFADAFFRSTLPRYVLDAISSQASILRTPTVTRLIDGTLWGWEGCHCAAGCCAGTCTHVWTYAQTIAYLFPQLERRMRELDYEVDLRESDGHMQFRMPLPPGTLADHGFHAAADGQMGNVIRTYREWLLCGDDDWLRRMWPAAKKALEYAWVEWDQDRDGLLEGIHHNTLDIEYHGPETVCGSMYLAALRAGEEMARRVGDHEAAEEYRRVRQSGQRLSDETLFDGEYYIQRIPQGSDLPYQYGPGCICDQVLGQWHARMLGLGDLYDPDHVRSAIAAVFRHNFRDDFFSHHNPHRVYACNDDRGLLICTWPKGGRPKRSVTYAFECMIGFEYQVGAHLIYEGFLREGLSICRAVRDRHDGIKRNPFNEFECGSHYARSMSNYAFLLALSGFRWNASERTLYLNPQIRREDFTCFFSVEGAWGLVHFRETAGEPQVEVEVLEGTLDVRRIVWDAS